MTELLELEDIDTPADLDGWAYLEIVVRFPDGTSSHVHVVEHAGDIPEVTELILDYDRDQRIDCLSPDDRETYFEHYDPDRSDAIEWSIDGCTCRAACFCYDKLQELRDEVQEEAFDWLAEHTRPGAIVTWRWDPFGASGANVVTDPSLDLAFTEVEVGIHQTGGATEWIRPDELLGF